MTPLCGINGHQFKGMSWHQFSNPANWMGKLPQFFDHFFIISTQNFKHLFLPAQHSSAISSDPWTHIVFLSSRKLFVTYCISFSIQAPAAPHYPHLQSIWYRQVFLCQTQTLLALPAPKNLQNFKFRFGRFDQRKRDASSLVWAEQRWKTLGSCSVHAHPQTSMLAWPSTCQARFPGGTAPDSRVHSKRI